MKKLLLIALLITPSAFASQMQDAKNGIKSAERDLELIKQTICDQYTGERRDGCRELLTLGFGQAERIGRIKELFGIK